MLGITFVDNENQGQPHRKYKWDPIRDLSWDTAGIHTWDPTQGGKLSWDSQLGILEITPGITCDLSWDPSCRLPGNPSWDPTQGVKLSWDPSWDVGSHPRFLLFHSWDPISKREISQLRIQQTVELILNAACNMHNAMAVLKNGKNIDLLSWSW